jgi:hypothetical protein
MEETPRSAQEIYCRTSESHRTYTVTALRLQVDDTIRVLSTNFEYRPDPVVEAMNPMVSFESGGRHLLVEVGVLSFAKQITFLGFQLRLDFGRTALSFV